MNKTEILKRLENIYTFDELYNQGVRVGDIVAYDSLVFDCGLAWDYVLLREGFPQEFNTALCCYKDPRTPEKMYINQIGFHWCGSLSYFHFRKITEAERKEFIDTCIKALYKPITDEYGWQLPHYAQILDSLVRYKLISKDKLYKINKDLKDIHNVNLLKEYKSYFM